MEELIDKLKVELIEALNLEEITPEDIDSEAPLFGDDGLGLDSIDALEIILILERNYGIKIENPAKGKYNPQIQISAESETKRSIFREKDKTKRSKKESAQHSKSRNKSFVMTSVSAL